MFLSAASPAQIPEERLPLVVTTGWLEEHLGDSDLVILHVAQSRRDYARGHIPGAQFLWLGALMQSTEDLSSELVPPEKIESTFESLGITPASTIILYGSATGPSVTRTFFTLDYMGLGDRCRILDGGMDMWTAQKRSITKDTPAFQPSYLTLRPRPQVLADAAWIRQRTRRPGTVILDARSAQYYSGTSPSANVKGHIPGAKNLVFSTLTDSAGLFLPAADMKRLFAQCNALPGDTVVTYCHVGQQATMVYFAARALGYPVKLYDGSIEDWGFQEDVQVETSPAPPATPR
jgi:thiosulfate/3-mercaptopyruvate sulfurtransferase